MGQGAVFFTGCDARLLALDLKTGQEKFAFELGALAPGSPIILPDRIIAGTEGSVQAISPDGKKTLWTYNKIDDQNAMFYSPPALADGKVVIGCRDRQVHAIDVNTGPRVWAYKTRGDVDAAITISAGRVYACSKDKKLYVLDLKTGKPLWEFATPRAIEGGPAVGSGVVVLADAVGNSICLEPEKPQAASFIPDGLGTTKNTKGTKMVHSVRTRARAGVSKNPEAVGSLHPSGFVVARFSLQYPAAWPRSPGEAGGASMNRIHRVLIASIAIVCAACPARAGEAPANPRTDKTLVAWVTLDDRTQRGGSVLTLQVEDEFDAIVFGEKEPAKWMAGSNFYRRTQKDPAKNPAETADAKTLVQMAIVYQGDQITLFRNGEPITSYRAKNIDLLGSKEPIAVFGLRHVGAGDKHGIRGSIDDARIYAQAMSPQQIQALQPNQPSDIKPYAWWDFEGDTVKDRAGRFPHAALAGSAKLAGGRLILGDKGVLVAGMSPDTVNLAARSGIPNIPYVEETPALPAPFPADWLTLHLAHPGPGRGHPGDPNCAFYYKDLYHLHYIYRNRWGFSFAHVSSPDMVTWTWHPTKLVPPFTGHGMFSGTGFFTKEGKPAIIYHGEGSGRNQIAYAADDRLDQWSKPQAMIVKTPTGEEAKVRHWDPDCWLDGDTYFAISGGAPPLLMKSPDLKEWTYQGELLHADLPANLGVDRKEDVSCANMFKIGDKWMLLCISHRLGCRYYLGDFKDGKYLPESHAMMNWARRDVFAPESLLTPDGRRVMWAWCLFPEKQTPVRQTAIQTLPRELSLPKDGVLRIRPLKELEKLRYDEQEERDITVAADGRHALRPVPGDAIELNVTFKPTPAREWGVTVLGDEAGNGFSITYSPREKALLLGDIKPPFTKNQGEDLNLRIFVDKGMVEVFANDRQAAVFLAPFDAKKTGITLFSKGAPLSASVKTWRLKSIYPQVKVKG